MRLRTANSRPNSAGARRRSPIFGALSALLIFPQLLAAQLGFVHTQGTQLVDGQGHTLMLRGTNLGNWLVREGYMFHFEDGPQSTREIEALTNELLGRQPQRNSGAITWTAMSPAMTFSSSNRQASTPSEFHSTTSTS